MATFGMPGFENDKIFQVSDILIKKGYDINETSEKGLTPLHSAVIINEPELVIYLLERGSDQQIKVTNTKSKIEGMAALELAEYLSKTKENESYSEVIKILKSHPRH